MKNPFEEPDAIAPSVEYAIQLLVLALRAEMARTYAGERLLAIPDAARLLGIGRSKLYTEMAEGRIRSVKVGRRHLVPADAVREYIEAA